MSHRILAEWRYPGNHFKSLIFSFESSSRNGQHRGTHRTNTVWWPCFGITRSSQAGTRRGYRLVSPVPFFVSRRRPEIRLLLSRGAGEWCLSSSWILWFLPIEREASVPDIGHVDWWTSLKSFSLGGKKSKCASLGTAILFPEFLGWELSLIQSIPPLPSVALSASNLMPALFSTYV